MIKESFEAYLLSNKDIPNTAVTARFVTKYQTRSDKSRYLSNWFVDYEQNGTGDPGDFYEIGDDGMFFLYVKNNSVNDLIFYRKKGGKLEIVRVLSGYRDIETIF